MVEHRTESRVGGLTAGGGRIIAVAKNTFREALRNRAFIGMVVLSLGFIGLSIMNPLIIDMFNVPIGLCVLNSGLILGLMAAPIMTTIAEDALKAVPDSYREAAEALGATRWQVVWRVVLPHARPGLSAAVLLSIGRAFGETIAVLMASGNATILPTSVFDSVQALTATIAAELGEAPPGGDHYQALFVLGILLFVITFGINLTADRIVRGRRRRK